ncbi:MAG: hypothetical protein ACOZQL_14515 [Myxococcota bacterium]
MKTTSLSLLFAAVLVSACGGGTKKPGKCATNADCPAGQTCDTFTGACVQPIFGGGSGGGGLSGTGGGGGGGATGGGGGATGGGGGATGGGGGATGGGGGATGGGGGATGGGGGACDGCLFNGTCIIRANSNNDTVCGQGGVTCATCTGGSHCANYVCTTQTGGGGGTTGGGGGTTGGGGGATGGGGGFTGGGGGAIGGGGGFTGGGGGALGGGGGTSTLGESCSSPRPYSPGLTGLTTVGRVDDYDGTGSGCVGSTASDVVFTVLVPNGQTLTATVTPDMNFDAAISVATSPGTCGTTCVAGADADYEGVAETATWTNTTGATVTAYLIIDGFQGSVGTFTLTASVAPAAQDDVCSGTLTTLVSGSSVNGTTTGYVNDYEAATGDVACNPTEQGPDRVYAFTVPSGLRATLTATPSTTSYNPTLTVMANAAACTASPRTCLTASSVAAAGQPETVRLRTPGSYLAIVDSASGAGDYTLGLSFDSPPTGDVCASATTLSAGTVSGSLTGYVNDYGGEGIDCLPFGAADRVYRATVPAGSKLVNTVTPTVSTGGLDVVLTYVVGSGACEALPRTCAGGADFNWDSANTGAATGETGAWTNSTGTSQSVFVIVGNYATASSTDFSMTTTLGAPPVGETCAQPVSVTASVSLSETLAEASSDVRIDPASTTCLNGNGLPDRIYSVTVPAGATMTAVVTPDSATNVAMNVLQGSCTAVLNCLSNVNAGSAGAAETATFTNSGGFATTVLVQVLGNKTTPYGITFTIQ